MSAPATAKSASRKAEFEDKSKEKDVRTSNIIAAKAVADLVRTSLGPRGMDKMISTPTGENIISNDGATILQQLRVQHPAAKMLVEVSKAQDVEAGDGTTTVVIIAGALLDAAQQLLNKGIHPTIVSESFQKSLRHATEFLKNMATPVDLADRESLLKSATTSLSSKVADRDATQHVPSLSDSTRKHCLAPFIDLIAKLKASPDVPPITCIISDGVMAFAIDAARHFGILEIQFWTTSACGFMAYLHHIELVRRGIVPFKDESFLHDGTLDQPVDFIPGMPNMKLRDMPSFIRVTDVNDIMFDFLGSEAHKSLKADAIILNTFDELEQEVLDAIAARYSKNIYTVGPFILLEKGIPEIKSKAFRSSLWKEDLSCLEWLDKREPDSVVYVNYGCVTTITNEQLNEFAWGLANSKHPFLWIVRPDVVMGESAVLPEEFYEEIKDRGLLVSWVPQDRVLQHPAVGVFLSHCGWNSTIECISGGKPMICWPFFAEQQTNCKYACDVWKTGVELSTNLKREELVSIIKEMMETEIGRERRRRAVEWRKKAEEAISVGGVSYNNFDTFIKEVILQQQTQ